VSGLARGIDTCAHQAALEAGGRTIAVLGTPLSDCYPPENQSLQQRLALGQLLISHVPFVLHANRPVQANREFFLQRNAIIAALSEALIVVEAGETSGAVVAARQALRQGRKLLIPQHCFHEGSLQWPSRLAAQGGICISNLEDISAQLIPASPHPRSDALHSTCD
jgi:DNA processing protein